MNIEKPETHSVSETAPSTSAELDLFNMKMLSVFEIIRWLKEQASFEKVLSLAAAQRISPDDVESIIDVLLQKKCIKKRSTGFSALTDTIFTEDMEDATKIKMYQMFSTFRKMHIRGNSQH